MTVATGKSTLNSAERAWVNKIGGLLKTSSKPSRDDDIPLGGVFPEILWEQKQDSLKALEALIEEMERTQQAQAAKYRRQLDAVRGYERQKEYKDAIKALDELEPQVKGKSGKKDPRYSTGVKDLDDVAKKQPDSSGGAPTTPDKSKETPAVPEATPSTPTADPNAAQYQKQVLKVGSKGPAVEYLQKTLGGSLKVDGKFGPATQGAVKNFQKSKGLAADGVVGPKTWGALSGGGAPAPAPAGVPGAAPPAPGGSSPAAPAKGAGPAGGPTGAPAKATTGFISASVGKGGKNLPDDVKAVQEALNKRGGANIACDGKCSPQTLKAIEEFQKKLGQFKPDGIIEPKRGTARALSGAAKIPPTPPQPKPIAPPDLSKTKATLDKGAFVWHSTRGILATNIDELKKGVRACYGTEHKDLLTAIEDCMKNLGKVVDKLDTRLADVLDAAYKAAEEQARIAQLKKAEEIMKEYLKYVNSEPLIGHMDDNPFGVKTSLKKVISDALKHLSQLLPEPTGTKS